MALGLDSVARGVERATGRINGDQAELPPRPSNPARKVQELGGKALEAVNKPVELMNYGFAVATNAIAQALPSFPAATLTSLYVAPPHGHLHPPSFTPPATPAPVPLPSLGPILMGTCVQVLINGLPAARAGDIGMAVTCCGFFPAFEVFTGSSKVFIGGMRAARVADICRACQPALAGAVRGVALAMAAAGQAVATAGVAADLVDAVNAEDATAAAAAAFSAKMGAAQAAADAAALAMMAAMGKDMAVPPIPGAIVMGSPNVLIGGFPMINFPNVAMKLFTKVQGLRGRGRKSMPDART